MSLSLYMDHHVRSEITEGLRRRGIDVLTADEDGRESLSDPELLSRATQLGRVFFSMDVDLLVDAARRQRVGEDFAGLISTRQLRITIGRAIDDLELIALANEPADFRNVVQYIPL
jgi:hypothetical protein